MSTLIWVEPRVILLTLYIYIDELLTRPKIIISIILYLFIVLGRFILKDIMVKDMDTIVSLAKHRGFVFPGSDIYGGLSNTWDYGPLGVELKIILKAWWQNSLLNHHTMLGLMLPF